MKSVREMIEERNRLVTENRKMLDAATDGKLSTEQEAEWDNRDKDIDRLNTEIEGRNASTARDERRKQYDTMLAEDAPRQAPATPKGGDGAELALSYGRGSLALKPGTSEHGRAQQKYREKFLAYTLTGRDGEALGLQVSKDNKGGYLAPTTMVARLIKFVDDNLFFRQIATVLPPLGSAVSLGVPTLETDPNDADWTPEVPASDITDDDAMTFGKRELMPHLLTKLVKISRKLLRSAVLDAEELVTLRIAYKMKVTMEKAYLAGDGVGKPLGVFTPSADGIPTSRDVATTSTTVFTADELIDLMYSTKEQYQRSGVWVAHRDFYKRARKLKDGNGQYLWQPGLQQGQPNVILERPVYMSEFAPNTFTTGLYIAIFGDFKAGYWIADSLEMEVQSLVELFARTNQVGLLARLETDGMPVLAEAFARLKLA